MEEFRMNVCRIQFRKVGKKYYFNPNGIIVKDQDLVVVETVRGVEIGQVVGEMVECPIELEKDIKPILRIATKKDIDTFEQNRKNEVIALEKSSKLIRKNELEMKLLYCEYTLDRQKLIIYFESEERVDFRQLVKDLAEEFRVRIELRQVGSRDGAKVLGGLGPCGLIVCCNTFIEEFDNVSIKMAKNQNLSLNPQKISGTCGKLLCCIKYENEVYKELRLNMPDVNDIVRLEEGEGKVLSVDVLKRELKVKMFEDEKFLTVSVNDVKSFKSKKNRNE
jgi:cell fate regulator YaaT (PSP1 superfamily)